ALHGQIEDAWRWSGQLKGGACSAPATQWAAPVSSMCAIGAKPRKLLDSWCTTVFRQMFTTQASQCLNARKNKMPGRPIGYARSSQPMPLVWVSTNRMFVMSFIWTFLIRWKLTTKRPGERDGMAKKHFRFCCINKKIEIGYGPAFNPASLRWNSFNTPITICTIIFK